jgi:hypothetical protein
MPWSSRRAEVPEEKKEEKEEENHLTRHVSCSALKRPSSESPRRKAMSCDHPGCKCSAKEIEREGRRYCSEECAAQAEDAEPGDCQCGHSDCA